MDKQSQRYFREAQKRTGLTGLNVLHILETRMDNVVYRMGLADGRSQASQLVNHGHFRANNRHNDVASTILQPGDKISARAESKQREYFKTLKQMEETRTPPAWIEQDLNNLSGRVIRIPERAEIDGNLNEQLIVEYYSR